jgi:hypothetical protein
LQAKELTSNFQAPTNQPTKMIATTSTSALLVSFQISGSAKYGFRVCASRDEGAISDGMFSRYEHTTLFPVIDDARTLLDRILLGSHYCARYNALGRLCNLAYWDCTSGVFANV